MEVKKGRRSWKSRNGKRYEKLIIKSNNTHICYLEKMMRMIIMIKKIRRKSYE
jgi:hypothetical protein